MYHFAERPKSKVENQPMISDEKGKPGPWKELLFLEFYK